MSVDLDRYTRKLLPEIVKMAHERMSQTLELEIPDDLPESENQKLLRVAVYLPLNDVLTLSKSYNMQGDPDECLKLGFHSGGAGNCWQTHEIVICDLEDAKVTFEQNWNMSAYQQSLVRPQAKSLLCVPIFNLEKYDLDADSQKTNPIIGVLCFDSDLNLIEKFARSETIAEAKILAGLISVALLGDMEATLNGSLMSSLKMPKRR